MKNRRKPLGKKIMIFTLTFAVSFLMLPYSKGTVQAGKETHPLDGQHPKRLYDIALDSVANAWPNHRSSIYHKPLDVVQKQFNVIKETLQTLVHRSEEFPELEGLRKLILDTHIQVTDGPNCDFYSSPNVVTEKRIRSLDYYYTIHDGFIDLKLWCGDTTRTNPTRIILKALAGRLYSEYITSVSYFFRGDFQEKLQAEELRFRSWCRKANQHSYSRLPGEENEDDRKLKASDCPLEYYVKEAFVNYCANPKEVEKEFPETFWLIQTGLQRIPDKPGTSS